MKLIVTEKPSVAKSIAAVLNASKRQDAYFEGGGYIVSWCFGHLVELAPADAYGDQYKRWSYGALPILPERWQYRTSKGKAKQLSVLCDLMNRADIDSIVCATDAGREGELIYRLVYNYCKCRKPTERLWISSMEDSAIRGGFAALRPGAEYDNLHRAALCRSQADWLVGINATRLFSCLYGATLNVGRVQSPTLAMIVSREAEIQAFTSEPFFTPEIDCGAFSASGEKMTDAAAAEIVRAACDGQDAVCLSVEKKHKTVAAPKLFDLTTLQREANRLFGFTAQQTLDYTQSLYEKKLCTYPRTDSRFLTSDMADGIPALIQMAVELLPFNIKPVEATNAASVINDAGVSDHHAIIPTMSARGADLASLPAGERSILQMLAVRLIAAVASAHSYEAVTAVLECGGHRFAAKGRTVLIDGWKAIDGTFRNSLKNKSEDESRLPDDGDEDTAALPEIKKGEVFRSVKASVKEGKTAPPRRYTEDTLLAAMECAGIEDMPDDAERRGIGTPSTRAAIIEKIIKSGFIERVKKNLVPMQKGINLIAVLPDSLKSPLLTAQWEHKLGAIEKGALSDAKFMDGIAHMTRELVENHSAPLPEYKSLFADSSDAIDKSQKYRNGTIGTCPRCGGGVVERVKGTGRMPDFFCTNRDCSFALWKDNKFFVAKKNAITKAIAAALLKEGRVFISDLYSEKTGKTYGATVVMEDTGRYVNFKLEFEKGRDS